VTTTLAFNLPLKEKNFAKPEIVEIAALQVKLRA
jgi:hypothetical protein